MDQFVEVYLKRHSEICITREKERTVIFQAPRDIYPKGLTRMSRTVPELNVTYEEPLNPEVVINSNDLNLKNCAEKIFDALIFHISKK